VNIHGANVKNTIAVRVERLERVVEDALVKFTKSEKYTHQMLEDLKTSVNEGFANDVKTDKEMEDRISIVIADKDARLKRIELALATALGGLVVIGWLINHAAQSILGLLAK
jgi:anti-sigma regulatory factor (Ser/Thr protein kinase)